MDNVLPQLLTIFTTPPGDLVFHVALAVSMLASLQIIISVKPQEKQKNTLRRATLGILVLFVGQIFLLFFCALGWLDLLNSHKLLPPLERAISTISLGWVVWLWMLSRSDHRFDIFTAAFNGIVVLVFFVTCTIWIVQIQGVPFNFTWEDLGWTGFAGLTCLLGLLALLVRRPEGWELGGAFLLINLLGLAAHFFLDSSTNDFAGITYFTQICTYPFLPAFAIRFSTLFTPMLEPVAAAPVEAALPPTPEKRHYSADLATTSAWLQLAVNKSPETMNTAFVRAVAESMLADYCFLITAPNGLNELSIQCGFDLIREEQFPGTTLEITALPVIADAMQRRSAKVITPETDTFKDLATLTAAVGLKETGSLLFAPIHLDKEIWGGIVLLSPYSQRVFDQEDVTYLGTLADGIAPMLLVPDTQGTDTLKDNTGWNPDLEVAQQQIQQIESEHHSALVNLKNENERLAKSNAALQQERDALTLQLQKLETGGMNALTENTPGRLAGHFEKELRLTLEEVARLQNQLAEANIRIITLQSNIAQANRPRDEERTAITSLIQELRLPLQSLSGETRRYLQRLTNTTDAQQLDYLKHVNASADKMLELTADLTQLANTYSAPFTLTPQNVDVGAVIDQAISDTGRFLREKNLTLGIELPENIPQLFADRNALLQILLKLLHNAVEVTPPEGTMVLHAQVEEVEKYGFKGPCLLFQIIDSGSGITPEELPFVFDLSYRSKHPIIPGVGDSGAGLSLVQTMVEAQGGHIWVESEVEKSTTFNVVLPFTQVIN
jgi:signal transduction histidine kinase